MITMWTIGPDGRTTICAKCKRAAKIGCTCGPATNDKQDVQMQAQAPDKSQQQK